jgi:Zn-dependent M28 family amino/carboxypeptidase
VKPKRSLLFVWHSGEESGLQGSRWFTDHPTVPRDSIVAQINIDMIGRGDVSDLAGGGPAYLEVLGSRRLSSELGDLVEQVNTDGKFGFKFNYAYDANGHPDQYYCRSDHANYARYGIPIVFFSSGSHRDYHQVTDEAQYLDYGKYATVVRYVAALTNRVADLDHRLVVDKPKPDPEAPCKQ